MNTEDGRCEGPDQSLASLDAAVLDDLVTVRDWLRFGISKFNEAQLVFGHGTSNALDEAAYLILHALHLPIDQIEPWLDTKLSHSERAAIFDLFKQRITKRCPAPYLTKEAWIKGHRFYVDGRVIVPRSFIGELLVDGLPLLSQKHERIRRILDLCTGSGCLAILAALSFPETTVVGADLSEDALGVAKVNVKAYGLEDRIDLVQSDLFEKLRGEKFDLILSNPPYVSPTSLASFPPEYASEPTMAHAGGGEDGLDLVRRILKSAEPHLAADGEIVVEVGQGQASLESDYPSLPFFWIDTEESEGEVFSLSASALKEISS